MACHQGPAVWHRPAADIAKLGHPARWRAASDTTAGPSSCNHVLQQSKLHLRYDPWPRPSPAASAQRAHMPGHRPERQRRPRSTGRTPGNSRHATYPAGPQEPPALRLKHLQPYTYKAETWPRARSKPTVDTSTGPSSGNYVRHQPRPHLCHDQWFRPLSAAPRGTPWRKSV